MDMKLELIALPASVRERYAQDVVLPALARAFDRLAERGR